MLSFRYFMILSVKYLKTKRPLKTSHLLRNIVDNIARSFKLVCNIAYSRFKVIFIFLF